MIIGLAIGSVHNLISSDRDDYITYIRSLNLPINAIEINFDPEDTYEFHLSSDNIRWIKSLKYKSLHLEPSTKDEWISSMWDKFVFHSDFYNMNFLPEPANKLLTSKKLLIENLDCNAVQYFERDEIKNQLATYWNICCDISHALSFGMEYLENFLDKYHLSIKEFHLSNFVDENCHTPFYNDSSYKLERVLLLVNKYNLSNVPIIIEENFMSQSEIINEVYYIFKTIMEN